MAVDHVHFYIVSHGTFLSPIGQATCVEHHFRLCKLCTFGDCFGRAGVETFVIFSLRLAQGTLFRYVLPFLLLLAPRRTNCSQVGWGLNFFVY